MKATLQRIMPSTLTNEVESQIAAIVQHDDDVWALIDFDENAARQRAAEASDGPLCGWSIAVKDIIDWQGHPTRCGATFTATDPAARSADIVTRLEQLGAFVMAKSVTTVFAFLDPGPTRNPWNLDHTPGGSSSGSAAAVASGMVRLALGSQTVASVNRPAAFCGVVGFKPTYGRLATQGMFPFSPSVDTVGFFTADARDAQPAFAALSGQRPASAPTEMRVGLVDDLLCDAADGIMLEALRACGTRLQRAGHEVRPVSLPDEAADAYPCHWDLVAAECAQSHHQLYSQHADQYSPNLAELIYRGRQVPAERLADIQLHREQTAAAVEQLFDRFDVLLCPAAAGAAPRGIEATGDPRMSLLWTYTGLPSLTLPVSLAPRNLPLGLQLIGRRSTDTRLLAAGITAEKVFGFSGRPTL